MSIELLRAAEKYASGRASMVRWAAKRCVRFVDAEDAVQDAALLAVERATRGERIWWRVAIRQALWRGRENNRRLVIGMPLPLPDAARLAETIELRLRIARAQRVLSRSELELLLSEYEGGDSRIRVRVRNARKKARHAELGVQ